jgi:plastocyanin
MNSYISKAVLCMGLLGAVASGAVIHGVSTVRAAEEKKAAVNIAIDNFSFTPREITVASGTTITWVNRDDVPHTVVSTDKRFKSNAMDTDNQFSFTFTDAGAYTYFCSVHPIMVGKIVVK